jgi:hypothetical protein
VVQEAQIEVIRRLDGYLGESVRYRLDRVGEREISGSFESP